jgi:YaiO family outer membrane protein
MSRSTTQHLIQHRSLNQPAVRAELVEAQRHAKTLRRAQGEQGLNKQCCRLIAIAGLILYTAPGYTADRNTPQSEIEASYSQERLSNNSPDWRNIFVEGSHKFKDRHTLYGGLRDTRRFGLADNEIYGGLYYPLAPTWTGVADASLSPTHEVLPKYTLGAQLQKILPDGWIAGVGLRHNEYTLAASNVGTFALERYWRDFRGAYTLFSGKPEGGGSAPAHRFQFNYYYGEGSSTGIAYTTGREVENVGPPAGLRTTDVRNWTLNGRHWFARDWAVSYELTNHRQGDLYRREGLRLGLRYRF